MKSYKKHIKISFLALSLATILSGCISNFGASKDLNVSTNQAFSQLSNNVDYNDMVQRASDESRFAATILQTRFYVVNNDIKSAKSNIETLKNIALTPMQQDQIKIMQGLIASKDGDINQALSNLESVNAIALPNQAAVYYYQLYTNVLNEKYKSTKDDAIAFKIYHNKKEQLSLVNVNARSNVLSKIVAFLREIPVSTLNNALNKAQNNLDKGFFEYALIDSSNTKTLKQKLLTSWAQSYSDHPLNELLNKNTDLNTQTSSSLDNIYTPQSFVPTLQNGDKVAVLLPLTGRFAKNVGQVAKLAVIAALQDRDAKISVDFYDTNVLSMQDIANKITSNGTKFIIGPVLKPEVDALTALNLNINTITLNEPSSYKNTVYYFDLGPDYDAANAAAKIYSDGHTKPLLIVNESEASKRVIKGFEKTFSTTGNSLANTCKFKNYESAKQDLGTCNYNGADSVYIHASSHEASAIKTLLKRGIDVYIGSESFDGLNNTGLEITLNGAFIGNMPWLITDSDLKHAMLENIPKANALSQKIFAATYDAVNVAFNLNQLKDNNKDMLHGLSGDIVIGNNNLIERSLMWYKVGSDLKGRF